MSRQVRLDPDVVEALDALSDEQGGSTTLHANRVLRAALCPVEALHPVPGSDLPGEATATVSGARGRRYGRVRAR